MITFDIDTNSTATVINVNLAVVTDNGTNLSMVQDVNILEGTMTYVITGTIKEVDYIDIYNNMVDTYLKHFEDKLEGIEFPESIRMVIKHFVNMYVYHVDGDAIITTNYGTMHVNNEGITYDMALNFELIPFMDILIGLVGDDEEGVSVLNKVREGMIAQMVQQRMQEQLGESKKNHAAFTSSDGSDVGHA